MMICTCMPHHKMNFTLLKTGTDITRFAIIQTDEHVKVSGPFVETSCVFQCIKNIINAEMWA